MSPLERRIKKRTENLFDADDWKHLLILEKQTHPPTSIGDKQGRTLCF